MNWYSNFWVRWFSLDQTAIAPIATSGYVAAPSSLVVPPGKYNYGVLQPYDFTQPGYYMGVSPDYLPQAGAQTGGIVQVLVPSAGPAGLAADCSACCHGMRYGGDHEPADQSVAGISNLRAAMRTSIISAACGTLARLAKLILESMGRQCRLVQMTTSQAPNQHSDGHVLCEVRNSGSDPWRAFDPLVHVLYEQSIAELAAAGWSANTPRINLTPNVPWMSSSPYPLKYVGGWWQFPYSACGCILQWDAWCDMMNRCKDQISYP